MTLESTAANPACLLFGSQSTLPYLPRLMTGPKAAALLQGLIPPGLVLGHLH